MSSLHYTDSHPYDPSSRIWFSCPIEGCSKSFKSTSGRTRHIHTVHKLVDEDYPTSSLPSHRGQNEKRSLSDSSPASHPSSSPPSSPNQLRELQLQLFDFGPLHLDMDVDQPSSPQMPELASPQHNSETSSLYDSNPLLSPNQIPSELEPESPPPNRSQEANAGVADYHPLINGVCRI